MSILSWSTTCSLVDNQELIFTNKSIASMRLGLLFSELGSHVRLVENSGGICLFLAGCLPLFLGVYELAPAFFLDVVLGANLEVVEREKDYCRC